MASGITLERRKSGRGFRVEQVSDSVWRVLSGTGLLLGRVRRLPTAAGDRFEAERLPSLHRPIGLGTFWLLEDALECFR